MHINRKDLMDIPKSKHDHYEQVRQELWHWFSDNALPLNHVAVQLRMNPRTLENFVYGGDRMPETATIFRVKRYLEEQYALRDKEHEINPLLRRVK